MIRRQFYFGFILATLIAFTVYLKANVLLPTSTHCSCSGVDDRTKGENERTLDHHSTKHVPLIISDSSNLPSKQVDLSLHDSRNPAPLKSGYIMSTSYSGWTGGGTGALLQLQCYMKLHALPMQVVEPAVVDSKFGVVLNETALRFSDLFDINQYNQLLLQDGKHVPLSPWNDFLQTAPRSTVFVKLHVTHTKPPEVECERGQGTQCDTPAELKFLESKGFSVVKIVNVFFPTKSPFTVKELKQNILDRWKPDEVTVVLNRWTYYYSMQPEDKSHYCGGTEWTAKKVLHPSERLLKDIILYEKVYQNSQTSVAVMMHAERLVALLSTVNKSMVMKTADLHLKKLLTTVKELRKKFPDGTTFGAVGIGRFGGGGLSHTFSGAAMQLKPQILQSIQNTLTSLYDNKWTFSEWEDTFLQASHGIADRGYIAAIQKGVASRAKCLVLFGGGRFQFLALNEYLHNHPKKSDQCISQVFVADRFKVRNNEIQNFKQ